MHFTHTHKIGAITVDSLIKSNSYFNIATHSVYSNKMEGVRANDFFFLFSFHCLAVCIIIHSIFLSRIIKRNQEQLLAAAKLFVWSTIPLLLKHTHTHTHTHTRSSHCLYSMDQTCEWFFHPFQGICGELNQDERIWNLGGVSIVWNGLSPVKSSV